MLDSAENRAGDMSYELLIFSGSANQELAGEIAQYLGTRLSVATIKKFSDGEISMCSEAFLQSQVKSSRGHDRP